MSVDTKVYVRRPFNVEAVQVTAENMEDVAQWCSGDIRTAKKEANGPDEKYVKVTVYRSLNDRQTKAFAGDWVLFAGTIFKVYTAKAFEKSFVEVKRDPATNATVAPEPGPAVDEEVAPAQVGTELAPGVTVKPTTANS